jgi:hypothetical protein
MQDHKVTYGWRKGCPSQSNNSWRTASSILTLTVVVLALASHADAQPCEPQWTATFGEDPGVTDQIHALISFDDGSGSGPALFVGGSFLSAGGVVANHIAKWDGKTWSPLGMGTNEYISALTVFDDGSGDGPALYVGGSFNSAGGIEAQCIAKWDGSSWSPVGRGMNSGVRAFAVFDDGSGGGPALYAGGHFTTAGGVAAKRVAKWDGTNWSPLGGGTSNTVDGLAVFDDGLGEGPALYACGRFISAGGVTVNRIAKWNGLSWSALGSGMNGDVYALAVFDDGTGSGPALHAGGSFITAGGVNVTNIAKWNGSSWSPLANGTHAFGFVISLTVFDDGTGGGLALYAGGTFTSASGVPVNRIGKWDGKSWSPLGAGMSDQILNPGVFALAGFDDGTGGGPALFAGGRFDTAGAVTVSNFAKWDGSSWSRLGSGMNSIVCSLEVFDDGSGGGQALFAGGNFNTAGGIEVRRIAKWDGFTWSPLGNGMDGDVRTLAVFDDGLGGGNELYAGGQFTTAGSVEALRIAKWDGLTWSSVGGGMDSDVLTLAVFDDGREDGAALYAAGYFTTAGGVDTGNIARWDGSSWTRPGLGIYAGSSSYFAMTVFDDGLSDSPALYVGGYFAHAGGVPANGIARWDGSTWSALGMGLNSAVHALTVFDDATGIGPALYAGGTFTTAGGLPANRIAKWNGESWSSLGTGMNGGAVEALCAFDDGSGGGQALYVGGDFATAGGVNVNKIARWDGTSWSGLGNGTNGRVLALAQFDGPSAGGSDLYAGGYFAVSPARDSYIARWQGCSSPQPVPGDINGDGHVNITDLLAVIANWGQTGPPGTIAADVNSDGVVNIADLLFVIAHWG